MGCYSFQLKFEFSLISVQFSMKFQTCLNHLFTYKQFFYIFTSSFRFNTIVQSVYETQFERKIKKKKKTCNSQKMALDQVYGISARLDEAKDVSAFPSDFENILQFTKPTNKDNASRKLAITFIPRYIKHFESQQNAAVDVLIDLCEDDAQDVSSKGK